MLVLAFLVAVASGTICGNSPLSVTQLQGILGTALKNLADPLKNGVTKTYTPNLIVGEQPWYSTKKPCNKTKGDVENCGYPLVFATSTQAGQGQIPSTWTFVSNPSVAYSGALTNQTKILHPNDPVTFADISFTIDFAEALIWLGCTPDVTYFGHSKLLLALRPPVTDPNNEVLGALGDALNNYNLKTSRIDTTKVGGGATLVIYTSSQTTYDVVSKAFVTAGFPASAINNDAFPTNLVSLGSNGAVWAVGSRSSNLTIAETAYLFGNPTTTPPTPGYFTLAQQLFPYVRLTPVLGHVEDKWNPSIAPITQWIPKVNQIASVPPASTFATAETAYEPHLWGVVLTVIQTLTAALAHVPPPVAGHTWKVFPQTASYFEEFGEQYVFEQKYHSKGGTGTRDNNYYFYNPGVMPKYAPTNVSIVIGFDHSSSNWNKLGKPTPHALFWNLVYNDQTFLGALGAIKGNDPTLQHANTFTTASLPLAALDPLDLVYLRVVGASPNTYAPLVGVLHSLGFGTPDDEFVQGVYPLTCIHRTYVNPDTGVAPWQASIVTPVQVHIELS